ncbi:TMhelix containing protein [Vibrio phage 1.079.O._10N.286.45.E9]|nr:TMhelix containing protein [Vibrio phage 1.079.O._10N.286.45.E9]
MIDFLLYFPLGTGWELAVFMAMIASYLAISHIKDIAQRRSKRAERQIFDDHREVEDMIFSTVITDRFSRIDTINKRAILRFIFQGYK